MQQLTGPKKSLTIQVPDLPKGKIIIHCLRHAQAHHNVATVPRPQRLKMRDPSLTSHGKAQAAALRKTLGASPNITHILCSPLKRTIQTAFIGLSPLLSGSQKIIAYPDIREWGSSNCSTGSSMRNLLVELKGELRGKEGYFDVGLVKDGWEVNGEDKGSVGRRERAKKVREDLWKLGQESLKEKGRWKGRDVGRGLESSRDVEIVVVSHAAFLGTLEGTDVERLRNAQWRTYEFPTEEDIKKLKCSSYTLLETRESKKRNDSISPTVEEALLFHKKLQAEKLKERLKEEVILAQKKVLAEKSREKSKLQEEALPINKKLHTEKSREKSELQEEARASVKNLHKEKSREKIKLQDETIPNHKKLPTEKSRDKLEEALRAHKKLQVQRSKDKLKAPDESLPVQKKLQGAKSKDKLKVQRKH